MSNKPEALFRRRRQRVRFRVRLAAKGRARLSVFRSSRHIYAQIIDDQAGRTLAAASTLDATVKPNLKTGSDTAAASAVGKLLAERAKAAGVDRVVFGSDYPVDEPLTAIRAVVELGFTDEEQAAILHDNADALLSK